VEVITFNKHQIYGILKDYHWKLREIIQLEKDLQKTDFSGVAQYGVEATLPHGKGIVGKAIENEIIRRSNKSERIYDYAKEVNFINENMHKVKEEKQKVVLDCMLDGFSISAIAHHMQTNRKFIHKMIDDIVDCLVDL
jgi:hypothetical protein